MNMKIQKKTIFFLFLIEAILFIILFSFFPEGVFAGIGENNVTVIANLTVGNVYPEVLNVSLEGGAASVSLIPNSSKAITCIALVRDYNGDSDIVLSSGRFFDNISSSYGASDDNNLHYTNSTCVKNSNFGSWNGYPDDAYSALINCSFNVWYYANPGPWNCTVLVNDSYGKGASGNCGIDISGLLALGLPDVMDYGLVNATAVSSENMTNVTNYGNIKINLSLSGYGFRLNDGNAMNCTLGAIKNISINYEKFNLTATTPGVLNLTTFEQRYVNLTSAPAVKIFNLNYRQNDTFNEAFNRTYWRIYVPLGVAGTCQGNIVFGAVQAPGT
jgi:hypothetical protein